MKQHPIIKELFINEDGTKIVYKQKRLEVKLYLVERNNYTRKIVNFMNKTHSVPKLVCETYNGMRKDASYTVQRKDFNPNNDNYSNLFWGKRGGRIATDRTKRHKSSKIKESDIPVIIKRIKRKETLKAIGNSYNVSDMAISRIKQHYITRPLKVLKEAVKKSKTKEQRIKAFATHFGYKTPGIAIQKMGKFEFETKMNQLLIEL